VLVLESQVGHRTHRYERTLILTFSLREKELALWQGGGMRVKRRPAGSLSLRERGG
jgi:hypothetical protein